MPKTFNLYERLLPFQKYIAIFGTTLGIIVLIMGNTALAIVYLVPGLFLLLTVTEKIADERSISLKFSSLYLALILAYTIKLIISFLYMNQFISFNMSDVNHFIILLLAIANTIYYLRLYSGK
jgi:hypothetical protein